MCHNYETILNFHYTEHACWRQPAEETSCLSSTVACKSFHLNAGLCTYSCQVLALQFKTMKHWQPVGKYRNWSDGLTFSLSLSVHLPVSSLFSPIQLLHRLNPDPSSLLFCLSSSLHPFLQLLCWIAARSPSALSYRRGGESEEEKESQKDVLNGKGWMKRVNEWNSVLQSWSFLVSTFCHSVQYRTGKYITYTIAWLTSTLLIYYE